jgi:hypothetical protein
MFFSNLKIIPPHSLIPQVSTPIKLDPLASQQPQLLFLVDTRWCILRLSFKPPYTLSSQSAPFAFHAVLILEKTKDKKHLLHQHK